MPFLDRAEAGHRLGDCLRRFRGEDPVVLGLPRGGVVVAAEVAQSLGAPLDVILVRKLSVPSQPELGMGAVGEGGVRVLNAEVVGLARVNERELAEEELRQRGELERQARTYRGDRPPIPLAGRLAIVVDDGIATGSTARAACLVARAHGARRVIMAAPLAPPDVVETLRGDADEVIVLEQPTRLFAIGQWYDDFSQTSDGEVVRLLAPPGRDVKVTAGVAPLPGSLLVPAEARGIVVFAHGSGSSRLSPRNRVVAGALNSAGLGTLLFDLLTPSEADDRANVFDVALLGGRLAEATRWLRSQPEASGLAIGYFGASTGAAAALWAAADQSLDIRAVVSRGGRPDLAGPALASVRAATLLIVGGRDEAVLRLNEEALARLGSERLGPEQRLIVIEGATHLFEEPGTLEAAAGLARDWFLEHLS